MKLIHTIILVFSLGLISTQASETYDAPPKFIKVGNTYETVFGMLHLGFQVLETDGNWIKVKVIKGLSKKQITGAIWLNVRELPIIMERSKDSKNEGGAADVDKRFLGMWVSKDPHNARTVEFRKTSVVVRVKKHVRVCTILKGNNLLDGFTVEDPHGERTLVRAGYKLDEMILQWGEEQWFLKKKQTKVSPPKSSPKNHPNAPRHPRQQKKDDAKSLHPIHE